MRLTLTTDDGEVLQTWTGMDVTDIAETEECDDLVNEIEKQIRKEGRGIDDE